jgi:hypothetical protein
VQFVGDVDERLRREVERFARWLRRWYTFPRQLDIRLVHAAVVIDVDGEEVWLRWWQDYDCCEAVHAEVAVGSFARNLEEYGANTAYPTVLAVLGRIVKHYFQCLRCSPVRADYAERWADRVLDAYYDRTLPPAPWPGPRPSAPQSAVSQAPIERALQPDSEDGLGAIRM